MPFPHFNEHASPGDFDWDPQPPPKRKKRGTRRGARSWRNKRLRIFQRDRYRCVTCGRKGDYRTLTLDHKIPRSKGGTNADHNLQTMCKPCNEAKADLI